MARGARAVYCSQPCYRRAAYLRHREAVLASRAAYRAAHVDLIHEQAATYRAAHREDKRTQDRERRAARRMAAQMARPRCMICDGPLAYGRPGHRLDATTCSRRCTVKRYRWFGRAA